MRQGAGWLCAATLWRTSPRRLGPGCCGQRPRGPRKWRCSTDASPSPSPPPPPPKTLPTNVCTDVVDGGKRRERRERVPQGSQAASQGPPKLTVDGKQRGWTRDAHLASATVPHGIGRFCRYLSNLLLLNANDRLIIIWRRETARERQPRYRTDGGTHGQESGLAPHGSHALPTRRQTRQRPRARDEPVLQPHERVLSVEPCSDGGERSVRHYYSRASNHFRNLTLSS